MSTAGLRKVGNYEEVLARGMETVSQTVDICDAAERQGGQAHVHFGNPLAMPDDAEDNSQALCRGQQSSTWPSPLSTLPKATVKHIDHQHRQVHCRGQQSSTLPSSSSTLPRAAVKHIDHQDRQVHCRGRMSTAEDSTALPHARPWSDETAEDSSQAHCLVRQAHCRGQQSSTLTTSIVKHIAEDNSQAQCRVRQAHCRGQQSSTFGKLTKASPTLLTTARSEQPSNFYLVFCRLTRWVFDK